MIIKLLMQYIKQKYKSYHDKDIFFTSIRQYMVRKTAR